MENYKSSWRLQKEQQKKERSERLFNYVLLAIFALAFVAIGMLVNHILFVKPLSLICN